jgi:hypothetical protein
MIRDWQQDITKKDGTSRIDLIGHEKIVVFFRE